MSVAFDFQKQAETVTALVSNNYAQKRDEILHDQLYAAKKCFGWDHLPTDEEIKQNAVRGVMPDGSVRWMYKDIILLIEPRNNVAWKDGEIVCSFQVPKLCPT